jgi:hypothetical protein
MVVARSCSGGMPWATTVKGASDDQSKMAAAPAIVALVWEITGNTAGR